MISIIIPVYNEQSRVSESLELIVNYLKDHKIESEIIVVNDGSKDGTLDILNDLQKSLDFKIISNPKNLGKGGAIKAGVNNAKGDLILFTDIDLSVPFDFIDKYLNVLTPETDIIIGTRANKESRVEERQFWLREMLGGGFTVLTNIILGVGVSDFTCGFKLFRQKAAVKIFNQQLIQRWAFDAESLFLARKHNFQIKEVPVVWRHRDGSKVRFPQDLIETFFSLIVIRINDLRGRYD